MRLGLSFAIVASLSVPAVAAPCPPKTVFGGTSMVTADGKLAFCEDEACWTHDIATGDWTQTKRSPRVTVTVDAGTITVCDASGQACDTLTTTLRTDQPNTGATNADRSQVAVWSSNELEIWDVKTKKRTARIPGWKGPMKEATTISSAQFIGTSLVVWQTYTPVSSSARVFNAKNGRLVGNLVKAGAQVSESVVTVGRMWAVLGFEGKLHLLKPTGAPAKKAILVSKTGGNSPLLGVVADGRIAVVLDDGPTLVDVANGKATVLTVPTCAK